MPAQLVRVDCSGVPPPVPVGFEANRVVKAGLL